MLIGFERCIPHLMEKLAEGFAPVHAYAQDERVHEEADQVFQMHVLAIRYRAADDDVVLAGIALQQNAEGRKQGHVQAGLMVLTQPR